MLLKTAREAETGWLERKTERASVLCVQELTGVGKSVVSICLANPYTGHLNRHTLQEIAAALC